MQLIQLIEELHRMSAREWAARSAALGVSYSEFEYLRAIEAQESKKTDKNDHGQHLQDVVEDMGVRKASASAMVVKLEERELVCRVPCRFDARAQHILLTAKGAEKVKAGQEVYEQVSRLLEARFDPATLIQFKTAINTIAD